MQSAYAEKRQDGETFFAWTRRVGKEYFQELLADLVAVNPDDVPKVLHDHGT